jgi:hypothetical protein
VPIENAGIRFENVNCIVFSGDDYQIAVAQGIAPAKDRIVRHVQWLCVDFAVDWKIKLQTERVRIDVAWR